MAVSSTVYGYITDSIYWNRKNVDLDGSIDTGLGYIDDILINYFHKIGVLSDPRESRTDILGEVPSGELKVYFDVSKMDPVDGPFLDISNEDLVNFFNILEKIYITQNRTEQELNNELILNEDLYSAYVLDSVRRSIGYTNVSPKSMRSSLKVYDYIEFTQLIDGKEIHFKLWINNDAFKRNYPHTTITNVVPPCDPKYLLDPSQQTTIVSAIISSAQSIFGDMNIGTTNVDHTGVLGYTTKWVISSQNVPEVKFGLMYQGAKPSSLEARAAIRDYLIGLGIANKEVWESRFPDLFVTAEFFLIPQWNNTTDMPTNKDSVIYPAIVKYDKLLEDTYRILPSLENSWINEHLEVLSNSFNPCLITAVPDPLNAENKFSMRELLPTYQAYTATDVGYEYQSAVDKEFARYLGRAIAALYGDSVLSVEGFSENVFNKRRYLSFSLDRTEYHVLYKEDFESEYEEE